MNNFALFFPHQNSKYTLKVLSS